jgi:precorrin-6B C5,15-methyltransferase / cobalt-precorrin-6B C5,C15-methyltransferase
MVMAVKECCVTMTIRLSLNPEEWSPPLVLLVGTGGGPRDLSVATQKWLDRAEVLVGGKRHLEAFADHPATKVPWASPLDRSFERVEDVSKRLRTAVLASGDPFYFGIGKRLVARLGKGRVLTFPNVTTVQTLFARIGESWDEARVLSLHGRSGSGEDPNPAWLRQVRTHPKVVLYTDSHHTPQLIARTLLEAGLGGCVLIVGEDLGTPAEKISRLSVQEAAAGSFSALNLVAILQEASEAVSGKAGERLPAFGLPESAYAHEAGMITKLEVRAVVLAHLQLQPDLVLWDLGAASGSVAIEAARVVSLGKAIAIEKNESRYRDLLDNIERLAPSRVQGVSGRALDQIGDLPDPDRVFIGGSGGELEALLGAIAGRLKPGGVVVQTAVSLDTVSTARTFWKKQPGFALQLLQVQVSHTVPVGRTDRLEPQNPMFILKTTKASS